MKIEGGPVEVSVPYGLTTGKGLNLRNMKNKLLFLFVACLLTLSGKAQPLPLYTITGRDTTVQIFLYSPGISEG
ncbi:MAG: hypothetical protein LKK56_08275, partial [Prevotella sp.]|nr:hypothetical protein [Prevotella sp.]